MDEDSREDLKMKWNSGRPVDMGYYLCAIVGWDKPSQLYWDGSSWSYSVQYESDEIVDNNDVRYYMNLDDIPMPESW
jgi:hypothetical protein